MSVAHPEIVSRDEWLKLRIELLKEEKELTRAYDRLNAKRRRLPMVEVTNEYVFETETGPKSLIELFQDKRQLIVYHFMFGPDWEEGCPGCTGWVNALGDLADLAERNTEFVICSRAPLSKVADYRKKHSWKWAWVSSFDSDFNRDFDVTLYPGSDRYSYNYRTKEETMAWLENNDKVREMPGVSVFFQMEGRVFHCYSTFARGGEALNDSYRLLDITPYGRQEDFEDSPEGWPQRPTYG